MRTMIILLSILILLIVIILPIYVIKKKSDAFLTKLNNNYRNIDLVVNRYTENVEWTTEKKYNKFFTRIFVYNKGPDIFLDGPNIIKLPNVGREVHTFLYHIIQNYNNLGTITLFTSGDIYDNRRGNKTFKTLKKVIETNNSVFFGSYYGKDEYNFMIENYCGNNKENLTYNNNNCKIIPSEIRPLGKWLTNIWPIERVDFMSSMCVFAVHKDHILNHPKGYYENLIKLVDRGDALEDIHFFERAWINVFSPIPNKCLYKDEY